jgi:hypothetical protein
METGLGRRQPHPWLDMHGQTCRRKHCHREVHARTYRVIGHGGHAMSRAGTTIESGRLPAWRWSAVIIGASVIGGVAAVALGGASVLSALIISILIGGVIAVATHFGLRSAVQRDAAVRERGWGDGHGSQVPGRGDHINQSGQISADDDRLDPLGASGRTEENGGPYGAVRMMGLPTLATPEPSWWDKTGPVRKSQSKARPAPPLSSYMSSAVIAQCPRCGSFAIDADGRPADWAFGCRACGHRWAWRPGTQWPTVEVRPGLRDERRRPP